MRTITRTLLFTAGLWCGAANTLMAQDVPVDYSKYPDYIPLTDIAPDPGFYNNVAGENVNGPKRAQARGQRPDHVDNSQKMFFPPVFNQAGGSCGSASRISYMFTYELNAYRNLNGKDPKNYYPSHFVWLLTNGNSGKDAFVQFVGVPSAATYGGQTYSSLFGYQVETDNNFGWMNGYDKWYEAMHNRMWAPTRIPVSVGSEEGREMLKNWLWNHNGDTDFQAGGVAGIGVASGGNWQPIPHSTTNKSLGVVGKYYVKAWGTSVDHALTIVGYDDRIEFDLDGDGKVGEVDEDEVGAWIVVNSWGSGWCNNGFIYCPYKHAVPNFTSDGKPGGGYYAPEIYHVRKDYKPERTIKLKMDYSHRSEIALSAGISADLNATEPDQVIPFHHFQYAGDGHNGNSNPAPEIPMLGKWADGKLHTEPMEFGYDLTDLTAGANRNLPIKYFFIIKTRDWAQGSGHIYEASIIDYKLDAEGIETPFDLGEASNVEIKSAGNKTIISCIVYGDGYTEPTNLGLSEDGLLTWKAPSPTGYTLSGYNVYADGVKVATTTETQYQLASLDGSVYAVTAVYSDGNETQRVTVNAPVAKAETATVYEFTKSGFVVPDVFKSSYSEGTIEFYIRPKSLENWNQSAGPGWGTFYMHANNDGRWTAGWNTGGSDRTNSTTTLKNNAWAHVAVVVNKNKTTIYVNGNSSGICTSNTYSGIGGFGNFVFNDYNAYIDELRFWNYARSASQIKDNYNKEFSGPMLPEGLLAYYKGGIIERDGKTYLLDVVGGNHAEVSNPGAFATNTQYTTRLTDPYKPLELAIADISGDIVAGMPVTISAKRSTAIQWLEWTCEELGMTNAKVAQPTVVFPTAGEYTFKVVGHSYYPDETVAPLVAEKTFTVGTCAAPSAEFALTRDVVSAGEHVTFKANTPQVGYRYLWTMPGARVEEAYTMAAGATYDLQGTYTVTLTVTAPDGSTATSSREIEVKQVAPQSVFKVSPSVILKGDKTYLADESRKGPNTWQWKVASKAKTYVINGQNTSFTPDVAGIYDVSLTTSNEVGSNTAVLEKALYVCNADSKNGLSMIGYPQAAVTAPSPITEPTKYLTIDFWLESSQLADFCNGIGDEKNTMLLLMSEAGALVVYIGGNDVASRDGFIQTTGWHHYAITFSGTTKKVTFYRDGVKESEQSIGKSQVPAMSQLVIGGPDLPMYGRIDELRLWKNSLSLSKIQGYAVAPIENVAEAESKDFLQLYYDFNQSGGDVQDRTSNCLDGVRTGFGPDGDAWGFSLGVFALNFDGASSDVTILDADGLKYDAIDTLPATDNGSVDMEGAYDLQGRRVGTPTRPGIYIVGRRKVLVK